MAARKKDPWAERKDDSWIEVGKKIIPVPQGKVFGSSDWVDPKMKKDPTPHDMPVFIIDKIETTGNGAKMIYFHREDEEKTVGSRWIQDIRAKWRPVPKPIKPRKPKVKPEPTSRFDRDDVI